MFCPFQILDHDQLFFFFLLQVELLIHLTSYYNSSTFLPLNAATRSGVFCIFSASNVALATLIFVLEPNDLEIISLTPASSLTARAEPPAITPVPSLAGFNKTFALPTLEMISSEIVLLSIKSTLNTF